MIFVTYEDKLRMLANAVKVKEEELLYYQVNIDNYARAIESIKTRFPEGATEDEIHAGPFSLSTDYDRERVSSVVFSRQLEQLLVENKIEMNKTQVMLDVIMNQLEGVDIKAYYLETTNS